MPLLFVVRRIYVQRRKTEKDVRQIVVLPMIARGECGGFLMETSRGKLSFLILHYARVQS
jgi:hypothetical protein